MTRPTGRPPKPLEEKIRTGNPGKRALPDRAELTVLPGVTVDETGAVLDLPAPPRPLDDDGRALWARVWSAGASWIGKTVDVDAVLLLCEQVDERASLRDRVLNYADWRDRAALRVLEKQITAGLALLGFNPVDRSRLGVAEVQPESTLERLRRERTGGPS